MCSVLAVRKKNGEEYEPSSLRAFMQSIDRHLRKNNYGFSVLNDKEFHEVLDILKKKQKQLKSIGKGPMQQTRCQMKTLTLFTAAKS